MFLGRDLILVPRQGKSSIISQTVSRSVSNCFKECYFQLQAKACTITKSNSPQWVFFTSFKLCKCYQIAQNVSYGQFRFENTNQFQGITISVFYFIRRMYSMSQITGIEETVKIKKQNSCWTREDLELK